MTQDPATAPSQTPSMMRSEERMVVRTEPVVAERVVVRRRIVTEEQTVRVQVRREELVIERGLQTDGRPLEFGAVGSDADAVQPLVIVLHREVPDIVLRTEAYEQVTVTRHRVSGDQQVRAELRHEVVELERDVTGTADPHPL